MSGILSGGGKTFTCKHLLQGAPDCVFCHRDQLKHELSLAEEGLANYQQEVDQLQQEIEVLRLYGNKGCTHMADAELERRRALPQSAPQSDNA